VTGGEIPLSLVQRFGPLGGIEGEHCRSQGSCVEPTPALIGKKLPQHFPQKLDVQLLRLFHPACLCQPLAKGGVELLASGKTRFLQVGRRLMAGIALERRAELVNDPAS
jgi:hypothetical protein